MVLPSYEDIGVNKKSLHILRQAAPVRTQTLQKLRQAILDDEFKPGDRLYEKDLCERLGVSRTSVREALRQLETEGLISTVPNQGPIVTRVSYEEARDIYQVRELLECLASRLFAERATDEQVHELARSVDDLEEAYLAGSMNDFLNAKTKAYEILFSGCGNQVAHTIFRSLVARVNFLRKTSLSQAGRPAESIAEIRAILRAIEERDPEKAYTECLEHVRRASAVAMEWLCRQRELEQTAKCVEE